MVYDTNQEPFVAANDFQNTISDPILNVGYCETFIFNNRDSNRPPFHNFYTIHNHSLNLYIILQLLYILTTCFLYSCDRHRSTRPRAVYFARRSDLFLHPRTAVSGRHRDRYFLGRTGVLGFPALASPQELSALSTLRVRSRIRNLRQRPADHRLISTRRTVIDLK